MRTVVLLAVVPALLAAASSPAPRTLMNLARPLTATEIAAVLNASRRALAAETIRLSDRSGHRVDVLMSRAGRPQLTRSTGSIIGGIVSGPGSSGMTMEEKTTGINEYTGRPALRCDGSVVPGELVIMYLLRGSTRGWTATARAWDPNIGGARIDAVFAMLRGKSALTSTERRPIRGRQARAFVSPWAPAEGPRAQPPILTGDPIPNVAGERPPNEAVQSLWIDPESLLPLRWEVSKRGKVTDAYDFAYEPIDLHRPEGVHPPQCIP